MITAWFYGGDDPQSLPLMMSHWEQTYGLGHNYILSLPPNPAGIITPRMAASAAAFGAERHRRYGEGSSMPDTPSECELARAGGRLAQWSNATVSAAQTQTQTQLVLKLPKRVKRGNGPRFDRVFLSEDVAHDGQLVGAYAIDACGASTLAGCNDAGAARGGSSSSSSWRPLVSPASSKGGQTIGTHHIDVIDGIGPATNATFVRLRLLQVLPAPVLPLISFRVLHVAVPSPIVAGYVEEEGLVGGQVGQGCPSPQIVTCHSVDDCVAEMAVLCSAAANCSSFGVVEGTTYAQPYGACGTAKAYKDNGWNLWLKDTAEQ